MREDSVLMQMQATAGVMPSYEYRDMPGMDWLRRRISSPLLQNRLAVLPPSLIKVCHFRNVCHGGMGL